MMSLKMVPLLLLTLVYVVQTAPPLDARSMSYVYTSSNNQPGVAYVVQHPPAADPLRTGVTYYMAAAPAGPTRGIVDTLTGYVTQAASSVTGLLPRPPYTVNVPDVFSGFYNRVTNGITLVQNAWQSRPALFRPPQASSQPGIVPPDELFPETNNKQPIVIFAPQAPIALPETLKHNEYP